jgi:hypothetical protein
MFRVHFTIFLIGLLVVKVSSEKSDFKKKFRIDHNFDSNNFNPNFNRFTCQSRNALLDGKFCKLSDIGNNLRCSQREWDQIAEKIHSESTEYEKSMNVGKLKTIANLLIIPPTFQSHLESLDRLQLSS